MPARTGARGRPAAGAGAARAARREPEPWLEDEPAREHRAPHRDEPEDLGQGEEPARPVDEDVLEETPDFLQETPEHDRLWFEQKPPRDFDFDS